MPRTLLLLIEPSSLGVPFPWEGQKDLAGLARRVPQTFSIGHHGVAPSGTYLPTVPAPTWSALSRGLHRAGAVVVFLGGTLKFRTRPRGRHVAKQPARGSQRESQGDSRVEPG